MPVAGAGMEDRHARAAKVAASRRKGFPMSPGQGLDRQSRSMDLPWTCGLVMDLSCTRRIPAPVTCLDHQAAKSGCATASEVPGRLAPIRRKAPGAFHLQRPYYWLTLDQGAGESQLVVDGNPGNWTDVPAD